MDNKNRKDIGVGRTSIFEPGKPVDAVSDAALVGRKAGNPLLDEILTRNDEGSAGLIEIPHWYGYSVPLNSFKRAGKKTQDDFLLHELVYQSNLIEGIHANWIETMEVGARPAPLAHELTDHLSCYMYVLENHRRDPTEADILSLHKMLMCNIFREKAEDIVVRNNLDTKKAEKVMDIMNARAGNYRRCKVWVGSRYGTMKGCMYYRQVPKAVRSLMEKVGQLEEGHTRESQIWDIHHEFETIHPFVDGNGRTGRLLLNWLSLRYLNEFTVVVDELKHDYYRAISDFSDGFRENNPGMHFYKDKVRKEDHSLYHRLLDADNHYF